MKYSISDAINAENLDNVMLKRRKNNMLLSDYQISVLYKFDIDYINYSNYDDLLFDIENVLNESFDDELDYICSQIAEYRYYSDTKK